MNTPAPLRRHLCFLDVGHGNSTVLIAGEESVVVVDVGRQSALSEFLLQQGITHIDSIYLSHADADHIGALTGIIATQQVSIGRVFLNSDASKDTKTWEDLAYVLDRARQAGSLEASVGLVAGRTEELSGDVCLRVLGPSLYLATKGAGSTHRSGGRIQTNSISAVISITVAGATLALLPRGSRRCWTRRPIGERHRYSCFGPRLSAPRRPSRRLDGTRLLRKNTPRRREPGARRLFDRSWTLRYSEPRNNSRHPRDSARRAHRLYAVVRALL